MKLTTALSLAALPWLVGCAAGGKTTSLSDLFSSTPKTAQVTLDSGSPITPGLAAYDVKHYTIDTSFQIDKRAISSSADMVALALAPISRVELDFDSNYKISAVLLNGAPATYQQGSGKLLIDAPEAIAPGDIFKTRVVYSGKPHVSTTPPWNGGFVWEKTSQGKPWIAVVDEGEGCDLWWPCKDQPSDEAESVDVYLTVPKALTALSVGMLVSKEPVGDDQLKFHWHTDFPVNDYGIVFNIGPYQLIEQNYTAINGAQFPIMFWYLPEHEEQAQKFFYDTLVKNVSYLDQKLGPYPWAPEKAGFVEAPFLGMEHQTLNAYGNAFKLEGFPNSDLSFHEFSHEYFGNLMTAENWADYWLHEGLAAFMEPVHTADTVGRAAALGHVVEQNKSLSNCFPVAPRGSWMEEQIYLPDEGPGGDIYTKGALITRSLNYLMGDDHFWPFIKTALYGTSTPEKLTSPIKPRFRTTDDMKDLASAEMGEDLSWFFDVYLRTAALPELQVLRESNTLQLTWKVPPEARFPMPVPVEINGKIQRVEMPDGRAELKLPKNAKVLVDPDMVVLQQRPFMKPCEKQAEH